MSKFPYNRIISYGCSFTAGDELGDSAIIGWEETKLVEYIKTHKITSRTDFFNKDMKYPRSLVNRIEEYNKTLSWPNFIARRYNVPLLNRSVGGASNELMLYYYMLDRQNGLIQPSDLVLFGLTSPARWFQFTNLGHEFYGVVTHPWVGIEPEYKDQLLKNWFNSYNIIHTYSKTVTFLSHESDLNNGQIKMCYAYMCPDKLRRHLLPELETDHAKDFYDNLMKMYPRHNFLNEDTCISTLAETHYTDGEQTHHAFGHPVIKYQQQFANILIEKMEKMYND